MPTTDPELKDPGSLPIDKDLGCFPPKVVWGREQGWLNVRDPWGQWHSIRAREAPTGYARLATLAKRGGRT
jgi:hypothetical protein